MWYFGGSHSSILTVKLLVMGLIINNFSILVVTISISNTNINSHVNKEIEIQIVMSYP